MPIGLILCGERNREQIELHLREMLEAKLCGAVWLAKRAGGRGSEN
jgi:hypothetical protein